MVEVLQKNVALRVYLIVILENVFNIYNTYLIFQVLKNFLKIITSIVEMGKK